MDYIWIECYDCSCEIGKIKGDNVTIKSGRIYINHSLDRLNIDASRKYEVVEDGAIYNSWKFKDLTKEDIIKLFEDESIEFY